MANTTSSKLRVAFFGPLPPSETGIAEYDEALVPLLREHYDLDVYVEGRQRPGYPNAFPHSEFYFHQKHRPYDAFVYQLGNNSKFHEYIYGYLFQFPGAVIFHDHCLHHSRAGMLLGRGLRKEYQEELSFCHGAGKAEIILRLLELGAGGDMLLFSFAMTRLVLSASLAAAAHTMAIAQKLQITDTPVIRIPHLKLPAAIQNDQDPYPGKFVIGSFGFATRPKRHISILQAVAHLRRYYPNIVYVIAGDVEKNYPIAHHIKELGLHDCVQITGRLQMDEFLKMLGRADAVVNLRFPFGGEMSGVLIRAMASAKPVLISNLRYFNEIPEEAVMRIRPDNELQDLVRNLAMLMEDPMLGARLGAAARRYVDENHSHAAAVQKYCELIEMAAIRKSHFKRPDLPLHLRSAEEIMRAYIQRTSFANKEFPLFSNLRPQF